MKYCSACRRHFLDERRICPRDGQSLASLPEDSPRTGDWLDNRYQIESIISGGGTSIVYEAYDLERDYICAVKVLRPEVALVPTVVRHFFEEGMLTRPIRHPGVVPIRDVALSDQGWFYLVMERSHGIRLDRLMSDRGRLSYDEVIVLCRDLLRILAAVHAEGVVHRDLKPENVLIEADRLLLCDFGSALRVGEAEAEGTPLYGTPEYMAPEWILHREASPAADLYALGVLMFEALYGEVPFPHEEPVDILRDHVHQPFPIELLRGVLPPVFRGRFQWFLSLLVEKDPDRRIGSALEALQMLEDQLVVRPEAIQDISASREDLEAAGWSCDVAADGVEAGLSQRSSMDYGAQADSGANAEEVVLAQIEIGGSDPLYVREMLEDCVTAWKNALEDDGAQVVHDSGDVLRVLYAWGGGSNPARVLKHLRDLSATVETERRERRLRAFTVKVGVAMGRVHYDPEWEAGPVNALEGSTVGMAARLAGLVPDSGVVVNRRFHDRADALLASSLLKKIAVRERLEHEEVYLLGDLDPRPELSANELAGAA